jgi:hypothetical protein
MLKLELRSAIFTCICHFSICIQHSGN